MRKIPRFTGDDEAADWFATHDTSQYMDDLETVESIPVARTHPVKKPVGLRLGHDYAEARDRAPSGSTGTDGTT